MPVASGKLVEQNVAQPGREIQSRLRPETPRADRPPWWREQALIDGHGKSSGWGSDCRCAGTGDGKDVGSCGSSRGRAPRRSLPKIAAGGKTAQHQHQHQRAQHRSPRAATRRNPHQDQQSKYRRTSGTGQSWKVMPARRRKPRGGAGGRGSDGRRGCSAGRSRC